MEGKPKISIIIPTFEASKTLSVALESILEQSFTDYEILIIDGFSTDNTVEIAKSYQDERIRIISERDNGIYDAMNKGIRLAEGEWLYFLGSDDRLFDNEVLENVHQSLLKCNCDVVYGDVIFAISGKVYNGEFTKLMLLEKNICHQSIFTKKSVFNKTGLFNIEYKALADWHFNIKWFNNKTVKRKYIGQIIASYYEDGYSFNNLDSNFTKDWNRNIKQYFPVFIRLKFLIKGYSLVIKRHLFMTQK